MAATINTHGEGFTARGGLICTSWLVARSYKEIGVEFMSLSKSYNMGGWRLGWVIGNPEIIASMVKIKANMDFSQFMVIMASPEPVWPMPRAEDPLGVEL